MDNKDKMEQRYVFRGDKETRNYIDIKVKVKEIDKDIKDILEVEE